MGVSDDIIRETGLDDAKSAILKTGFLKRFSEKAHLFYGGKVQTVPKAQSLVSTGSRSGTLWQSVNNSVGFPGIFKGAMHAIKEGLARVKMTRDEIFSMAQQNIAYSRNLVDLIQKEGYTEEIPIEIVNRAFEEAMNSIR